VAFGAPPPGLPGRVIRCGPDDAGLRRAARWASGRAVGLALSSGGSKTVAHLGVFEVLRRAGIPVDAVAGTSGGALVAVGIGFEVSDEQGMRNVRELAESTRLRRFDPNPRAWSALSRGRRLHALFESWFPDLRIEDAAIPVITVAADLHTGEEVVITHGTAADAMRASMSLPVFLDPWRLDGRMLVDGATITPVPEHVLRDAGVGYVVASSVAGQERSPDAAAKHPPNIPRTVLRLIDSMERALLKTQEPRADVLIRPQLWLESTFNFSRAVEVREAGVRAAEEALPAVEAALARLGALR
jgi:NTE family protein